MSKKLPLEIQRNYTVITEKDHWKLKCLVCNQAWQLNKPKKGESIHGGNVLALLDHSASHPLPAEEAEVEMEAAPVSQVNFHDHTKPDTTSHVTKPAVKSVQNGVAAYRVEWYGNSIFCHMVKVSHFKVEQDFPAFRKVQQVSDNQYNVVLQAANHKHAQLVGERLIRQYLNNQQQKERSV